MLNNSSVIDEPASRTPSTICKNAKLMQKAQEYAEILNGRPQWNASGRLFNPIFDRFCRYFNDTPPNYRTASSADDVDDRKTPAE